MNSILWRCLVLCAISTSILFGCAVSRQTQERAMDPLTEVAHSERQWTGVAVSQEGRIFVNFPRWSDDVPFSVGEIMPSGDVVPFPNEALNTWDLTLSATAHFICVQSVYIDTDNYLWILDPANPKFEGVIKNGPKLFKIDLETGQVVQRIYFDDAVAPFPSYLNDVRVDTDKGFAYLTDSGLGAIIVVDLATGRSRRLLSHHMSVKSENITLVINGNAWRQPDGSVPKVHADGLALDSRGEYLYYQALSGRSLYRIATKWLRDETLSHQEIGEKVEFLGRTGAADGIELGPDGHLYLSAIEANAVNRFTVDRRVETVVQDPRLAWPDSLAVGPNGFLYVTTSQIHLGAARTEPYRIFKIRLDQP